ncbi:MAG: hypothetical protein ACUVWX_01115 [Kiritimatiellia bacterium]
MFLREMLVVSLGNELTLGLLLACWLFLVGTGACLGRFLLPRPGEEQERASLAACMLLCGVIFLPFQLHVIRLHRTLMAVPLGQTASLAKVAGTTMLAFPPSCLAIGAYFPLACALISNADRKSSHGFPSRVSSIYTAEALGSTAGGITLSFVLLPRYTPLSITVFVIAAGLIGVALLATGRTSRLPAAIIATAALGTFFLQPHFFRAFETLSNNRRWRSLAGAGSRLIQTTDTVYQNLALAENAGQYAIYGSGQVLFAFPDLHGTEHTIHFIMGQNPRARKMLLLGGNPIGDIPELLKYAPQRIVQVDLDPAVLDVLRAADSNAVKRVLGDPRVTFVSEDAPRYVQRCQETFDVIIVNAPEPRTTSANRYYTVEFFRAVRRILSHRGFMYIRVAASELLQLEAALPAASIYKSMRQIFPVVLVTAGTEQGFFAGNIALDGHGEGLTLNREILYRRSSEAGITNEYFRPEYFLVCDELAPERIRYIEDRLITTDVPLNTTLKPIACFYNLFLWSRFTGSEAGRWLHRMRSLDPLRITIWVIAAGIALLALGGVVLRTAGRRNEAHANREFCFSRQRGWAMSTTGLLMASTGFLAMALEMMLIFLFQSLFGYVYSRLGLIVALFMIGLALGAPVGRKAAAKQHVAWRTLALLEGVLFLLAVSVPHFARWIATLQVPEYWRSLCEPLIYLAVGLLGLAVGAEFTLVNRAFLDAGGTAGKAAALAAFADSFGSALGALSVGVLLVPLWGIAGTALLLAALKVFGLLCLGSAALVLFRKS